NEVAKASIELTIKDIGSFLKNAGKTETSTSVNVDGIKWQLRVETSAANDDGRVQVEFSLEGAHANGAWSRWVTADFFILQQAWRKVGGVREKLVGFESLPCNAGEPDLIPARRAHLKKIHNDKRKDELSAEAKDQLHEREKVFG
ncbi:hypothetical protein AAVH_27572, partial [Aphelenchoides avenae]